MRAAVETATKADTIRTSRHHNSDIAAQATAGESGLLILLLKSKQRVSFFLHEDWLHATSSACPLSVNDANVRNWPIAVRQHRDDGHLSDACYKMKR